jgi:putative phosphoribosyl transferase
MFWRRGTRDAGSRDRAVTRPWPSMRFPDRRSAGKRLAEQLTAYANRTDVLVLGLARGGVPVAFEVAQALHAPLEVCVVRKLGTPGAEELAMGAIASGDVRVLNDEVIQALGIDTSVIARASAKERRELTRRERLYRGQRPWPDLRDKTAILVDDGMATGATMRAAIVAVRKQRAAHVIVAAPVAAPSTCEELRAAGIEVVCVMEPEFFLGVGMWYEQFPQTSDDEVRFLLDRAWYGGDQAPDVQPDLQQEAGA